MLEQLKRFFDDYISPDSQQAQGEHGLHLAAAALLVEIMQSDDEADPREHEAITSAIRNQFDLEVEETHTLIELAHQELEESVDYHQFTSLINASFDYEQKVKMIELLWRVAFADNDLDRYEEHAIRKIAELLHVRHSDFVAAKHRVSPH